MQPAVSSSSLRPQPPSSSFSLRPPLHSAAGRPPVGSFFPMTAVRNSGNHNEQDGNMDMRMGSGQQIYGNSSDVQQKLGNPNGDPQGVDDLLQQQGIPNSPLIAVTHNRSKEKESLEDFAGYPSSDQQKKESVHSMHQTNAINALTMENLASQLADLRKLLETPSSRQHRPPSRSMSRGPSRPSSRPGRNSRRANPTTQPPMERAWNKVVQQGGGSAPHKMSLQYFSPDLSADGVVVNPPIEVAQEGMNRWQKTLVGYFIEGRPSFMAIKEQVTKLWGSKGLLEVMANDRGFFFFNFATAEDCTAILEAGPWIFQRQPLFLQPWKPGMRLFREAHDTVPLWIKLFNVPLEYWSEKGFSYLGSAVGVPLFPDSMTASGRCVNFMRLCVEVSASKPLLDQFDLVLSHNDDGSPNHAKIRVEYPWKPKICSHCHVFGHTESNCFKLKKEKPIVSASGNDKGINSPQVSDATLNGEIPSGATHGGTGTDTTSETPQGETAVDTPSGASIGGMALRKEVQPVELPSNPKERASRDRGDGVLLDLQQLETMAGGTSHVDGTMVIQQLPPITTSPNKFLCLDEDDDTPLESPMGMLALKIQHIDGGLASARKKKNKAKAAGGTSAPVGHSAQQSKHVR